MDDLIKTYGKEVKTLLTDKKNQQALAIVGAVYLLSKENKERNSVLAGLAALAFLPDGQPEEQLDTVAPSYRGVSGSAVK